MNCTPPGEAFHEELLDECEAAVERFEDLSLFIQFIDRIFEVYGQMEEMRKDYSNAVKLMTIPQSKGLEFNSVFILCARRR